MITILCANKNSLYKTIPGLDVWDEERDAYYFTGSNPVITHAPCQQWSKLKALAHNNKDEKELAYFCLTKVKRNGGIFEHPDGSQFLKQMGITKGIYRIDQNWWGFRAQKRTLLYMNGCKPAPIPILTPGPTITVERMDKKERSITTIPLIHWLCASIQNT